MHVGAAQRGILQYVNPAGVAGIVATLFAILVSPAVFLGLFGILGVSAIVFVGLALCVLGLIRRPRWFGVVGCVLAVGGAAFWAVLFAVTDMWLESRAAKFGLTTVQHSDMCMSAMDLAAAAEAQREADRSPPAEVDVSGIDAEFRFDPWGRPFRYVLNTTPRGYTFMTDGPDATAGTNDDIDIFTIRFSETCRGRKMSVAAGVTATSHASMPA